MRPTFELRPDVPPDEIFQRMRERLERSECPISGLVARQYAELMTRSVEKHFWSPVMFLEISERDGGERAKLRGRFAPHPNVWTGFMAIYAVLFMLGLGSAMYGLSEWQLGWSPRALLGIPIALALAAFTYGAAFIGQGLGAEEMYELRAFLDRCIENVPDRTADPSQAGSPARTVTASRTGAIRYD